jgi:hypothetical protein
MIKNWPWLFCCLLLLMVVATGPALGFQDGAFVENGGIDGSLLRQTWSARPDAFEFAMWCGLDRCDLKKPVERLDCKYSIKGRIILLDCGTKDGKIEKVYVLELTDKQIILKFEGVDEVQNFFVVE